MLCENDSSPVLRVRQAHKARCRVQLVLDVQVERSERMSTLTDFLSRHSPEIAAWDFDGVIADSEPVQRDTYLVMLRARGIEPDANFFGPCIGKTEGEIWAHLRDRYALTEQPEMLRDERIPLFLSMALQRLTPSPLASRLLPALRERGIRQVIVSSGNTEVLDRLLRAWRIEDYFDGVLGWSPNITSTKRERLVTAVGRARGLVLEDDLGYLAFARSIGASTIGVRHSLNQLPTAVADLVIQIDDPILLTTSV
jgi:beta-phosphoglucomutase-like phosphatase (HAD superfamily)